VIWNRKRTAKGRQLAMLLLLGAAATGHTPVALKTSPAYSGLTAGQARTHAPLVAGAASAAAAWSFYPAAMAAVGATIDTIGSSPRALEATRLASNPVLPPLAAAFTSEGVVSGATFLSGIAPGRIVPAPPGGRTRHISSPEAEPNRQRERLGRRGTPWDLVDCPPSGEESTTQAGAAGAAGYSGLYQANVAIPAAWPPGLGVSLTLKQGGAISCTVSVAAE
jgi:hypothetical protein